MAQQSKLSKKNSSWLKWLAIFLLFVFIALACAAFYIQKALNAPYPVKDKTLILNVEKGETYNSFIQKMADKGIINSPNLWKLYQKYVIKDTLKVGVYSVKQGMTVRQVMDMVSNAQFAQMNRVVLIDGTNFKQFKTRLKQDPNVKNTILDLPDAEIMQKIGAEYNHPEGLFAPDTYFFAKGATDVEILKELHQRQIRNMEQAWQKPKEGLPYKNKYEMLTMASIIEKETSLDAERNMVAGVFVRRLQIGMRLQTDPTVIYGMGDKYDGNIRRTDLQTPTPYNTYTIDGLPPTPIAMPSLKSMNAAMQPDDSKNIYFVATGNGGHKFTENLQDHNRAVQEYLAVIRSKK
ncbi:MULTISPECIES: endolytic transglycosylase MltG [unclassified Acinetobacter]|uniref:endolytic transglycosylase MltG n=1 Tax=unclassified Acinetobacter TaxID=196816 RepID=UPI0035B78736